MLRRESLGKRVQFLLELVLKLVKNPPAMQETWVLSLGWVDPLEKGKATLLPVFWPGEFHGLYNPWGCKESDTTERLSFSVHFFPHLLWPVNTVCAASNQMLTGWCVWLVVLGSCHLSSEDLAYISEWKICGTDMKLTCRLKNSHPSQLPDPYSL